MSEKNWVAVWGVSPSISEARPARYAKDLTLRYFMTTALNGSAVRVRLNNIGSTETVHMVVYINRSNRGAEADTPVQLTFGGKPECVIPGGEMVWSDPVDFATSRGDRIAVSMYFADFTHMASGTNCDGPLTEGLMAEGSFAHLPELPSFYKNPTATFFFLDTVEVAAEPEDRAIICFGDSITSQSWPDWLLKRVLRDDIKHVSVVRRGISGSRVLREYEYVAKRHYGESGMKRFEREVGTSGTGAVIVFHGVNDIIHPEGSEFRPWSDLPTAEQLIAGLRAYVEAGHKLGVKVYLATITTIKGWMSYLPLRDDLRHAVNEWIRTQTEADGVIDFDAAIRQKGDTDLREPEYDSGDHLHPSLKGAEVMAESIPEELIRI